MKVISPVPTGSGAHILHKLLQENLPDYTLCSYPPLYALFPPLIYPVGRTLKADIVHTIADYAIFSYRSNVPLVTTFHNYYIDDDFRPYSSVAQNIHYATDLKWLIKLSLRYAKRVTAVSHFIGNKIYNDLGYQGEIRVIHNGIDSGKFYPATNNQFKKQVVVLFVGNLIRRKGANLLPAIAERLDPGITVQFTTGFRKRIRFRETGNLVNIGDVAYRDMPSLYSTADMLLFPTAREGFGLAVAEAMACGLPVIATNCSSMPELIDDNKGGFLCDIGNVEMFAEKINLLAQSSALRQEMGEYNRCKVERYFTLDRMAREYKELFEEVLSTNNL